MTTSLNPPKPKAPRKLGRIALKGLGYLGFFLCCFSLFSYWFFPYDRLRDVLLQKFNQPSGTAGLNSSNPYQIKMADLGPWRLTGVHLRGVEFTSASSLPGKEPIRLSADDLWVRISLWSLLSGGQRVSYEAAIGSGEVSGQYSKNSEKLELSIEYRDVDVSKIGLGGLIGLPVKGRLDGTVEFSVPADPAKSQGKVRLKISKYVIGNGKAKLVTETLRDGFTIDAIDVGDVQFDLDVRNGVAQVTKLTSQGKDLQLTGNGSIRLATMLQNSSLNLILEFKFADAYKQRNDRTRALFDLMNLQPQLKRALTPEGSLRYQISGKVTNLRAQPAGRANKSAEKARKRK
jgi:type II secretion system protein N